MNPSNAREAAELSGPPDDATPFSGLTPDAVLNAIDQAGRPAGLATTGTLLTLNSYENRVYQAGVEDADGHAGFIIAKFYRPGRWTDAQIEEEHAFVAELAEAEVPAVPARVIDGRTLHHVDGQRVALFARRGGRAPNLDDPEVLEWIGRFLGRLHAVGAQRPFAHRPPLDAETFGREPRAWLLAHDWVPPELRTAYASVSQQALDGVQAAFGRAGAVGALRLHGDVHEGNVLWRDTADAGVGSQAGPHFVDFDDARNGPAIQDLWMLLSGSPAEMVRQMVEVLDGYRDFADFDRRELQLIEPLRTLRLVHYAAWIARRWADPAFPAAFPWFGTARYWQDRILELREQLAAMSEPAIEVP